MRRTLRDISVLLQGRGFNPPMMFVDGVGRSSRDGWDLRGAEITGEIDVDVWIRGCDLRGAELVGVRLCGDSTFRDCNVVGARFVDCNLSAGRFYGCDMLSVGFERVIWGNDPWDYAGIDGVDFDRWFADRGQEVPEGVGVLGCEG